MTCKYCGKTMEIDSQGYYLCHNCGAQSVNQAGKWYHFEPEEYDYEDVFGKPEGCAACGNPAYPECKDGCNLFDD